jgi:hypothetical protein
MSTRRAVVTVLMLGTLCCTILIGQERPKSASPVGALEFPVVLEQSVIAGKTPAGTKIQARLAVATLVDGTVIPRNAIFSGEVIESAAKTKTTPSCLAIRMDLVRWKNLSGAIKVYATAWYYPAKNETGQNLQYGPTQPANRTWNGEGQYPDPNSKVYRPFPGGDSDDKNTSVPDTPTAVTSNQRVLMKDVETTRGNDGTIALISKRTNIKLDKLTTYVLAPEEVAPAK